MSVLLTTGAGVATGGGGDGTTGAVTAGTNGTPAAANAPAPGVEGVVTVGATPTGPAVDPKASAPPAPKTNHQTVLSVILSQKSPHMSQLRAGCPTETSTWGNGL